MSGLNLAEALPLEMARVRDSVLPCYLEIGAVGSFAATLMRRDLDLAAKSMVSGDIVSMLQVYDSLKGWQV